MKTSNERGFTLLELLVVVVIVGILMVLAVIGFTQIKRDQINHYQRPRLMEYAQAQEKFRANGKRRYGTLKELCQEGLLTEMVAKMDSTCNTQSDIQGWTIEPGTETAAFLKDRFFAKLKYVGRPTGDKTRVTCIAQDGVLRIATETDFDNCSTSNASYQP